MVVFTTPPLNPQENLPVIHELGIVCPQAGLDACKCKNIKQTCYRPGQALRVAEV